VTAARDRTHPSAQGDTMTPTALDRLFLTVPCLTCSADPGTPCTIRRGPPDRTTHLARQDRAVRAEQRHTDRHLAGGAS